MSTLTTTLKEGRCILNPLFLEARFFCLVLAHKEWNPDPHKISKWFVTSFCWIKILFSSFPFTTCGSSDLASQKLQSCQSLSLSICHTPTSHVHWCVQPSDAAVAPSIAGRGMGRGSRCRWSLEDAVNQRHLISWCLNKGNLNYWWTKVQHIRLRPGCFKHLNTVNKIIWTFKLALHFAGCILSLDADRLCTLQTTHTKAVQHTGTHTEGFLADCKVLPFPATHTWKDHYGFYCPKNFTARGSYIIWTAYLGLCVQTTIWYLYSCIFPHHNYHDRCTESPGDMQSMAMTPLWTLELVQGGGGVLEVTKSPGLKKKLSS